MNRRMLIATVAAMSLTGISMAGITAASAEYDSAGVGTINPERFGYSSGYQDQGYMAYGSADTRVRTYDGYAGPRAQSYEYRAEPRGNVCVDQDGMRVSCR